MAFCSNCGEELANGAKFCSTCGTALVNNRSQSNLGHRKIIYGSIYKCPNCGEVLNSFIAQCPSCGFELRGIRVSDALWDFEHRYAKTMNRDKQISIVKSFVIPNTAEDILEFMLLADSNTDPNLFFDSDNKEKDFQLANAWIAKFDQANQKAEGMLPDLSRFQRVISSVREKKQLIKKAQQVYRSSRKRNERSHHFIAFTQRNRNLFFAILVIVAVFLIAKSPYVKQCIQEHKLSSLAQETELLINSECYDDAKNNALLIVANSELSAERREAWDKKRELLLQLIEDSQKKISIGSASSELKGMDYLEAFDLLEKRGFLKISFEKIPDLVFGWVKKEGEVENVVVGGISAFSSDDKFEAGTPVVISYHVFKNEKG